MSSPRCAPLLLLLLLPPLLPKPPAGDAAVITGVSGPRCTCPPGIRARLARAREAPGGGGATATGRRGPP